MRAGELLKCDVVDRDGVRVGNVEDIRLVQDGPLVGEGVALPRVDGLVVSHRGVGIRLGYYGKRMKGPWLLRLLLHWLERGARFVPWDAVQSCDDGVVRLTVARADLPHAPSS
jgi:sporulation protein YlmC with PRC-barrel domain